MKTGLVFLTGLGLSGVAIHQLLGALFPSHLVLAWTITGMAIALIFLIMLTHYLRTYHERIIGEVRRQWRESSKAIEILSECITRGKQIYGRLEEQRHENDSQLEIAITQWSSLTVSELLSQANLSEQYIDELYKSSVTGKEAPEPSKRLAWMNERLTRLENTRTQLEQPPQQPVSHASTEQTQPLIKGL